MALASLFYLHVNDTKCPKALIRAKTVKRILFVTYFYRCTCRECVYLPATVNLSPTITHLEL